MEIIKSYWGSKEQEQISETQLKQHANNITRLIIGTTLIKNFKTESNEYNRHSIRYALKGTNLKYYVSLLNHSFAVNGNTLIALQDANWSNYKEQILTNETINLLNS